MYIVISEQQLKINTKCYSQKANNLKWNTTKYSCKPKEIRKANRGRKNTHKGQTENSHRVDLNSTILIH